MCSETMEKSKNGLCKMAQVEPLIDMAVHSLQMHVLQLKILRTSLPSVVQVNLKPRPLAKGSVQGQ